MNNFYHFFHQTIAYLKKVRTFALVKQNNGAIAQLVEQRTENPCVPGSIPGGTTKNSVGIVKPIEIQSFQWVFLLSPYAAFREFEQLEMSHSVVFPESLKKATESILFHLFTSICATHFQEQ